MKIEDVLREDEAAILEAAWPTVAQLDHYRRDGAPVTRRRVEALYRQVVAAVTTRRLGALRAHAGALARERFAAGFDLYEVRTAFAIVEDAIWRRALARLPSSELAWVGGPVWAALADGEAAVARTYVALAQAAEAGDVPIDAVLRARPAEELVYPV